METIHVRKEQDKSMNRESYQLPHIYDSLLCPSFRRRQQRPVAKTSTN